MNSFNLIYRELPVAGLPIEITLTRPDTAFKQVRQVIKPHFNQQRLNYKNPNGHAARQFNRHIGRFKWDWLEFLLPDYQSATVDYPSNEALYAEKLIQETAIASEQEWGDSILEQTAEGKIYLMVGMQCLIEQDHFRPSMLSSGIPAKLWPCPFQIFEFIITNAPLCLFIKHRAHVII